MQQPLLPPGHNAGSCLVHCPDLDGDHELAGLSESISGLSLSILNQDAHLSHAVVSHCHDNTLTGLQPHVTLSCPQSWSPVFSFLVEMRNVLSQGDFAT